MRVWDGLGSMEGGLDGGREGANEGDRSRDGRGREREGGRREVGRWVAVREEELEGGEEGRRAGGLV